MLPMRLLPNLALQLEQCGEISMWFVQIIESVLNLEVMKLDVTPLLVPLHTHTHSLHSSLPHCGRRVAALRLCSFPLILRLHFSPALSKCLASLCQPPFTYVRPTHTRVCAHIHGQAEGRQVGGNQ